MLHTIMDINEAAKLLDRPIGITDGVPHFTHRGTGEELYMLNCQIPKSQFERLTGMARRMKTTRIRLLQTAVADLLAREPTGD